MRSLLVGVLLATGIVVPPVVHAWNVRTGQAPSVIATDVRGDVLIAGPPPRSRRAGGSEVVKLDGGNGGLHWHHQIVGEGSGAVSSLGALLAMPGRDVIVGGEVGGADGGLRVAPLADETG